jgi:hypothetical protein
MLQGIYSSAEIARFLGISETYVWMLLYRYTRWRITHFMPQQFTPLSTKARKEILKEARSQGISPHIVARRWGFKKVFFKKYGGKYEGNSDG